MRLQALSADAASLLIVVVTTSAQDTWSAQILMSPNALQFICPLLFFIFLAPLVHALPGQQTALHSSPASRLPACSQGAARMSFSHIHWISLPGLKPFTAYRIKPTFLQDVHSLLDLTHHTVLCLPCLSQSDLGHIWLYFNCANLFSARGRLHRAPSEFPQLFTWPPPSHFRSHPLPPL